MFNFRNQLHPLHSQFSNTALRQRHAELFAYTSPAIVISFTSSISSNGLRYLEILFGIQLIQYWRALEDRSRISFQNLLNALPVQQTGSD